MADTSDTLGMLNLDTWNAIDTGILSYVKTPMQQTAFNNNSDLIGKALRHSILYFADTVNTIDRPGCILGNEFRSTRTHRYQTVSVSDEKGSEAATLEITAFAPIAFEYIRSAVGITRQDFQSSFNQGDLVNFANTGRSGSQMYKTLDDVSANVCWPSSLSQSLILGLHHQNSARSRSETSHPSSVRRLLALFERALAHDTLHRPVLGEHPFDLLGGDLLRGHAEQPTLDYRRS